MSDPSPQAATAAPKARGGLHIAVLVGRALAPVNIADLVWFRIAFGAILLVEVCRYFQNGWIGIYYVEPAFLFKYYGFGWVRPWPGNGMSIHFAVLGALAVCITLGIAYRVVSVLFFVGFTYVFLLDQARYLNHFYLVCLYSFLMIFVPAHRAFSVDAWLRPGLRKGTAPAWTLWLLRMQICVVYFFGGVAKLNGDWLRGEPMRMWLAKRTEFPLIGRFFTEDWMAYLFSYGGLAFDFGIVPLLLWRRTRWFAFGLALIFNVMNSVLFHIGIFPWFALGATVLLFTERLPLPLARVWRPESPAESGAAKPTRGQHATLALAGAYFAVQLLMPLRHWLYPGKVHWTELGHRFSWHMKLRDKDGTLRMTARNPETGDTWRVHALRYINNRQYEEAATRPDMILQLCHHISAELEAELHHRVEVRVEALASLNGRPRALLIDPQVDLAAEPRTLGNARWILPLTIPLGAKE